MTLHLASGGYRLGEQPKLENTKVNLMRKNRKGRKVKQEKQVAKEVVKQVKVKAVEQPKGETVVNLPPPPEPAKPLLIKVLKPETKYRGAREAWFARLKEFDGKSLDDYVANCKEKCPQLTKAQTAENPTGWVSFFKREGVLELKHAA